MNHENEILSELKSWKDVEVPIAPSPTFLSAIGKETQMRCHKAPVHFSVFLKSQIRFIGARIWAGQAILLLCALLTLWGILKDTEIMLSLLMPQILFYLSLLVSGVILPVLYRSFRYQMHEIETTTYYATPRILLAKLIVVGVGDLAILGSLALLSALRSAFSFGSSVLYLLCPFLLASFGIIYLMRRFPGKMLLPCSAGLYGLLALGYRLLRQHYPMALEENTGVFWGVICLVLLALCSFQLVQIEKSSDFSELQLV